MGWTDRRWDGGWTDSEAGCTEECHILVLEWTNELLAWRVGCSGGRQTAATECLDTSEDQATADNAHLSRVVEVLA